MKKVNILLITACISFLFSIQSFAGWVQQENGQWKYDQNGALVTSQWIEDQGSWYYFDANGVMLANTTQNIDGIDYTFDASGKWISPDASNNVTYHTYTNTELGYSLQIPLDVTTTAFDGDPESFDISSENLLIQFTNHLIPAELDTEIWADIYKSAIISGFVSEAQISYIDSTNTQLGEFTVTRTRFLYNGIVSIDSYICIRGHNMLSITTTYGPDTQQKVQGILSTLKELR